MTVEESAAKDSVALPVAWCPPEVVGSPPFHWLPQVLARREFTTKSDVW